jgi:hypothetical protein
MPWNSNFSLLCRGGQPPVDHAAAYADLLAQRMAYLTARTPSSPSTSIYMPGNRMHARLEKLFTEKWCAEVSAESAFTRACEASTAGSVFSDVHLRLVEFLAKIDDWRRHPGTRVTAALVAVVAPAAAAALAATLNQKAAVICVFATALAACLPSAGGRRREHLIAWRLCGFLRSTRASK